MKNKKILLFFSIINICINLLFIIIGIQLNTIDRQIYGIINIVVTNALIFVDFLFIKGKLPALKIGSLIAFDLIIIIENFSFDYIYFLLGMYIIIAAIDFLLFAFFNEKLPYGIFHKTAYNTAKIIAFVCFFLFLYVATKQNTFTFFLILAFITLFVIIIGFYVFEFIFIKEQKEKIFEGKRCVDFNLNEYYHEDTININLLNNALYLLINGRYEDGIRIFTKINNVREHEHLYYFEIKIIVSFLVYKDYKKIEATLNEELKYVKNIRNKKLRKFLTNLYTEYKKYAQIVLLKKNVNLLCMKKKGYLYHCYNFFNYLDNKKENQNRILLPIEKDILNLN